MYYVAMYATEDFVNRYRSVRLNRITCRKHTTMCPGSATQEYTHQQLPPERKAPPPHIIYHENINVVPMTDISRKQILVIFISYIQDIFTFCAQIIADCIATLCGYMN